MTERVFKLPASITSKFLDIDLVHSFLLALLSDRLGWTFVAYRRFSDLAAEVNYLISASLNRTILSVYQVYTTIQASYLLYA